MRILFCNITYLNKYEGKIASDAILTGGSWVKEHEDAHEKWNFLNMNGLCYGFVQNPKSQFRIEQLEGVSTKDSYAENSIIVWCARNKEGKTVIVGWYENAKIYREYLNMYCTPISGLERSYMCETKAEDAYLLPDMYRTFEISRASETGQGTDFGQQNYWYANNDFAKENIIPEVMKFIEAHRKYRINAVTSEFGEPDNLDEPISEWEVKTLYKLYEEDEYKDFLPLGYRYFKQTNSADEAFALATALRELHQYDESLKWYNKVVEIEGESWENQGILTYMNAQCEHYEEAIKLAKSLLDYPECSNQDVKDEVYGALADNNFFAGNIEESIKWIDKVLEESSNEGMKEFVESLKTNWSQFL
ncbi:hypothetical protein [Anaerorhabdus sp.]|uniref:hypothetical protein n=1 Tax=Anaerorhabdus sp. TaxID=1872524 RepID=UPI002FC5ED0A